MSIVITGATGHLGRLVVERLLDDGTPAGDIIATGRDLSRLEPLAARGVTTRRADFADPAQRLAEEHHRTEESMPFS
jgi:NAD(P)H dehydrogenase (quinone)